MFAKASTKRAFEDLVEQVTQAIVQGRLKLGDRLPPQRELKEIFQVSRATVIEALRVLESTGLISIKTGTSGGAFVTRASSDTLADSLLLLLNLEAVSLEELGEFRERVEGGTAYWAALRASDEQIRDLDEQYDCLCAMATARTPWAVFLAQDFTIHQILADYSRNLPAVATMRAITRAMQDAYTYISHGLYDKVISDIGGIVEAVSNRRPDLAEERMKQHIAYFNKDMMANRQAKLSSTAAIMNANLQERTDTRLLDTVSGE